MSEANETRVFYKTITDFANLKKELRQLRQDLAKTKAAEQAYNAASVKDRTAATKASTARAKAMAAETKSLKANNVLAATYAKRQVAITTAVKAANIAINAQNRALKTNIANLTAASVAAQNYAKAQRSITRSTGVSSDAIRVQRELNKAQSEGVVTSRQKVEALKQESKAAKDAERETIKFRNGVGLVNQKTGEVVKSIEDGAKRVPLFTRALDNARRAMVRFRGDGESLPPVLRRIDDGAGRVWKGLQRFSNFRPRLIPPFVALVPIIGAVVAAINPLIALLGSLGGVAIGLAGNIGSLAGAFLALPGILSGVAAGIGAVISSMGGVGNVFKTYSAMQKALGKSPGQTGQTQAERAEQLANAERNLAKAQKSVTKAQESLNKAREEALQDLIDLRTEVSRASLNEERAIANLQQARDAYNNVMADPGSQLGDKLDAAARIKEAEADLEDVRKKNIQNQKDLNAAEKKGIEQSDKVVDAQENLADAYEAQRDAQRALKTEASGGKAAVEAVEAYNEALAQLSPSARKFVLAIISMQDQWKAFRKDMQENFFGQFVDVLDRLPQALNNLGNFLRPAAKAMGDFARNFLVLFTSPEWNSDLKTIGDQNGKVLDNLGRGALAFSDAIKDLIIAAGPFTDWMTGAFADGLENFSQLVETGRETGSLASWLDKVRGRLQKWWQIVKNIGATIFNYSTAASSFGDWISDGFLQMTENWKKASENAKEPGSKFQQWLEDIKPLLEEVDGLLGDFFSWFSREAMNKDNITDAQDLVKLFRDDLGPAIGGLLDTLAKTDIDEKFIEALSSIVESIDSIMKVGGNAGFQTFFDIITGFFQGIADFLNSLPPGAANTLFQIVGALSALALISKFPGVSLLVDGLLKLLGAAALGQLGTIFSNLATIATGTFNGAVNFLRGLLNLPAYGGTSTGAPVVGGTGKTPTGGGGAPVTGATATRNLTGLTKGLPLLGLLGVMLGVTLSDDMITPDKIKEDEARKEAQKNMDWWGQFWDNFWNGTPTSKESFPGMPQKSSRDRIGGGGTFGTGQNGPMEWLSARWSDIFGGSPVSDPTAMGAGGVGSNQKSSLSETVDKETKKTKSIWTVFWRDFNSPIASPLNLLKYTLDSTFKWIDQNVFTPFKNAGKGIETAFQLVVTNLGNIWTGIRSMFATPINWVLENVYNNGIVSFWNSIASKLNLPQLAKAGLIAAPTIAGGGGGRGALKMATGGVLPGYTPGRDVHSFYSNTGGQLDLSGGEAIMRPEWTKMVGGPKAVNEMNRQARRGFATGGVLGDWTGGRATKKTPTQSSKSKIPDFGGDVPDSGLGSLGRMFTDPIGFLGDGLKAAIAPLMGGIAPGAWGDVARAIPNKVIDGLLGMAKTSVSANHPGGGAGANALGWQRQWAIVHNAFPKATLNSAYRPGAKTVNGGTSYHASGRAIDVTPSMEIFNWIRQNYPNSRELIYSPAGNRQLQNGKNYFWGEPVRSQHWNHVHWAMKNGGVFDNGGWMNPGQAAFNFSGKPEAVLTNEESRGLKALLSGSNLVGAQLVGATPGASLSGVGSTVVDASVNVENLVMQNPVPEKPSTSMAKGIRQIAYMNQVRSEAAVSGTK